MPIWHGKLLWFLYEWTHEERLSYNEGSGRENAQAQTSDPNSDALKKNLFCALQPQGDQEISSNVVTGMLQVFSINVMHCWIPVPIFLL